MNKDHIKKAVQAILAKEGAIDAIAAALERLWRRGEKRTQHLVKKEQREKNPHLGIAVETLQAMGREIGKEGKTKVGRFSELAGLLWNEHGREGRIVAAHILGELNEAQPENVIPLCRTLVATCVSWEECDTMTYGIEPAIRRIPVEHLDKLKAWLADDNKWVKRAALNVIARLPMKQPAWTGKALSLIVPCLTYPDSDVRRTCSFAIRLSARGDRKETLAFLKENAGGDDRTKIWVFSDALRTMTKAFLQDFAALLPVYRRWRSRLTDPVSAKSLDAAIAVLEKTK